MADIPPNDALLHPVRMRIVVALAGRRLTAGQLRAELADVPQATLYQHLGRLTRAGTLRVVEERPARGAVERVYALDESSPTLRSVNPATVTTEELRRYYISFIAALLADGSRYLRGAVADPAHDGFGFRLLPLYLTDEELGTMSVALKAALAPFLTPAPGRRRLLLSTVLIPQTGAPEDPERASPPTPATPDTGQA
ncbi:MAG TPA: helix-turn-helix domain-containing protein [Ktedonobacterales bacterium]